MAKKFDNNPTKQVLVDYAAKSLAPYTLLECLCETGSDVEGMGLIYKLLNTAIRETMTTSPSSGLSTGQSLLVWEDPGTGGDITNSRFKLLSLGSGDSQGSTGSATTVFGGDGGIYTKVKYAESLYAGEDSSGNNITTGSAYVPYLVANNDGQKTVYLKAEGDPTTGNRALICDPSGSIGWGAAGAIMNSVSNQSDTQYCLVGTLNNSDGTSPSNLYYNTGVYFRQGNLYHTSDETLKSFTNDLDINFDNLATIKKGYFYWKEDPDKILNIGVTAQSVEDLYPEVVTTCMGYKAVDYSKLSVIALAAIDKLHERITELEAQVEQLKKGKN